MISTLYIEQEVYEHPRARAICERFADATQVVCERYSEVFNPKAQNFRLQKRRPALILAKKHDGLVLNAPQEYAVGGTDNYYFSHMLNCVYDCRYCFLQGMYRSAHHVLFVNYEAFECAIDHALRHADGGETWFFSGYDCDSLALEPVSRFAAHFIPFFAARPNAYLELRTKSTQIRTLLYEEPIPNVVVAFSFTPEATSRALEHKVSAVHKRIQAMVLLQRAGWNVGLRLDPLIYQEDYQQQYAQLLSGLFSALDAERLHSVSLGVFRLPRQYFKTIAGLYPDEALFAGPLEDREGMVSYRAGLAHDMIRFCTQELLKHVPERMLIRGQVE